MEIKTSVLLQVAEWNVLHQRTQFNLKETEQAISAGLVQRLVRHSLNRLAEAGFDAVVKDWSVEVYTMDADEKPSDRCYTVKWQNPKGGYIEVSGIHTRHGWPTLDFGFEIGHD